MAFGLLCAFCAKVLFFSGSTGSIDVFFGLLHGAVSLCCFWGIIALNFSCGLDGPEIRDGEVGTVVAIYEPHSQSDDPKLRWWHVVVRVPYDDKEWKDVRTNSYAFETDVRKNFAERVKVGSRVIKLRAADGIALFERHPEPRIAAAEEVVNA